MYKNNLRQGHQDREFNWILLSFSILTGLIYLFFTSDVAAVTDYGNINTAHTSFSDFIKKVGSHITNMQKSGHVVEWFVNAQFITFATYRLTMVVGQYAFDRADLVDVFSIIMLIAIVQIFISFYSVILSGLFSWSNDIAGVLQKEIVGNDSTWFVVEYMSSMLDKIQVVNSASEIPTAPPSQVAPTGLLGGMVNGVGEFFSSAVDTVATLGFTFFGVLVLFALVIPMWILNIVIFIGTAWAIWGFALAKLIGLFFIPFLLIEKLAPLFDGWFRFLIGFLVYGIIVKVNGALAVLMFSSYLGFGTLTLPLTNPPIYIVADSFENILGLLAMLVVSILAVLSTGGFATAIAGGVGGFGGALATVARSAAIIGTGGATAAAVAKKS